VSYCSATLQFVRLIRLRSRLGTTVSARSLAGRLLPVASAMPKRLPSGSWYAMAGPGIRASNCENSALLAGTDSCTLFRLNMIRARKPQLNIKRPNATLRASLTARPISGRRCLVARLGGSSVIMLHDRKTSPFLPLNLPPKGHAVACNSRAR